MSDRPSPSDPPLTSDAQAANDASWPLDEPRSAFNGLFDSKVLALIAVAIVLNFVGGEVVKLTRLPVYGDSIGTMLLGILGGPLVGAVGGAASNLVLGLRDPNMPFFAPVSIVIGAAAGWFARWGFFPAWQGDAARRARGWSIAGPVLAGLATGLLAAIVATPIATVVFGGVTGGPTDVLVAAFRTFGLDLWHSVLGQSVVSDPIDKLATALLAFAIVSALPRRTVAAFPLGPRLLGGADADPDADPDA
ncbi:MAG: ECF transporter S component [Ardenticatenales bacterium]